MTEVGTLRRDLSFYGLESSQVTTRWTSGGWTGCMSHCPVFGNSLLSLWSSYSSSNLFPGPYPSGQGDSEGPTQTCTDPVRLVDWIRDLYRTDDGRWVQSRKGPLVLLRDLHHLRWSGCRRSESRVKNCVCRRGPPYSHLHRLLPPRLFLPLVPSPGMGSSSGFYPVRNTTFWVGRIIVDVTIHWPTSDDNCRYSVRSSLDLPIASVQ